MPEQSISRGKYNFNKHQRDKQNKIMQYYRRSFKSQLAPAREITRPRRTRKLHIQPNPSSMSKLTKTQTPDILESEQSKGKELDKKEKNIPSLKNYHNFKLTKLVSFYLIKMKKLFNVNIF